MNARRKRSPLATILACISLVCAGGAIPVQAETPAGQAAEAKPNDPALTPLRPPAGFPTAIVGAGLDYRNPDIAKCMARDGEGVPIAWDFIDNNELPFSEDSSATAFAKAICQDARVAPALIIVRYSADTALGITDALGFTFQTPARLVIVANHPLKPRQLRWLRLAGERAPDRLFIVDAKQFPEQTAALRQPPSSPVPDTVLVAGDDEPTLQRARRQGFTTLSIARVAADNEDARLADAIRLLGAQWGSAEVLSASDLVAALRLAQHSGGTSPTKLVMPTSTELAGAIDTIKHQKSAGLKTRTEKNER